MTCLPKSSILKQHEITRITPYVSQISLNHLTDQNHEQIDPKAPELHAIPWELLRDPGSDLNQPPQTLAASRATPFSRYLATGTPGTQLLQHRPIKLLVGIAAPDNLAEYQLSPIDSAAELALLEEALSGLPVELIAIPQPCTLSAIEAALQKGPEILHLICHGGFSQYRGEGQLYLADGDNKVVLAREEALAQSLAHLGDHRPHLIFLSSCQSATRHTADAWRGLAPRLVKAGVPAVLAMQDLVSPAMVEAFTGPPAEAQARLLQILAEIPRLEIITNQPAYVHAITRSPTMGFIDDVEFVINEEVGQIDFRAAARLGYSDMDANRKRLEVIRAAFEGK